MCVRRLGLGHAEGEVQVALGRHADRGQPLAREHAIGPILRAHEGLDGGAALGGARRDIDQAGGAL